MLKYSFIQFPGVGAKTEQKLWGEGILTWADYQALPKPPVSARMHGNIIRGIKDSQEAIEKKDTGFFQEHFPKDEIWRLYADFIDATAYISVVGSSDNASEADLLAVSVATTETCSNFLKGHNLDELPAALKDKALLVSFQGSSYDVEMMTRFFPDVELPTLRLEVREPLKRLGYKGTAAQTEKELGMLPQESPEEFDHAELAALYEIGSKGNDHALVMLKSSVERYALALKPLMDFSHARLWEDLLPDSTSEHLLPKVSETRRRRPVPTEPTHTTLTMARPGTPGQKVGSGPKRGGRGESNGKDSGQRRRRRR